MFKLPWRRRAERQAAEEATALETVVREAWRETLTTGGPTISMPTGTLTSREVRQCVIAITNNIPDLTDNIGWYIDQQRGPVLQISTPESLEDFKEWLYLQKQQRNLYAGLWQAVTQGPWQEATLERGRTPITRMSVNNLKPGEAESCCELLWTVGVPAIIHQSDTLGLTIRVTGKDDIQELKLKIVLMRNEPVPRRNDP